MSFIDPSFLNYTDLIVNCDTKKQKYIYFDSSSNNYCQLHSSDALDYHKRLDLNSLINLGEAIKKNLELPSDALENLKNRLSEMGDRHDQKLQEKFGIFSRAIRFKERFVNLLHGVGFCTIQERASKIFNDIIACPPAPSAKDELLSNPKQPEQKIDEQKTATILEDEIILDEDDMLPDEIFFGQKAASHQKELHIDPAPEEPPSPHQILIL